MTVLARAGAVVAAAVLTASVALAAVAATLAPASCALSPAAPVAALTGEQAANARVIVAVGGLRGVPARGLLIALMTAMQESGLRNLDYGDRDSLGLFQQRPSTGWGTPDQVRDPAYAAAAFFGGPTSPTPNRGLLDIPAWQQLSPGAAAQAVQRSAFPDAYARWQSAATSWLAALHPEAAVAAAGMPDPSGGGCAGSSSAQVVLAAAARWLGTPYAWGGGDLMGPSRGTGTGAGTVGFDCSGLTRYAWAQTGILLPRTAAQQWNAPGQRITTLGQLASGDLIFFAANTADPTTIFHVALALGGDGMLEAPATGDVVKIVHGLSGNSYWAPRFIGALRPSG